MQRIKNVYKGKSNSSSSPHNRVCSIKNHNRIVEIAMGNIRNNSAYNWPIKGKGGK